MEDGKKMNKITVLYEDNHIIVVEKPINMLSQSDNTKDTDLLTLVKVFLKTGRHHQIRVQFAYHKHPLCGDQRYGKQDKTQIALYAYQLELIHPTTKEKLVFQKLPPKIDHWTQFTVSNNVH